MYWRRYLRSASVYGIDAQKLVYHMNQVWSESPTPSLNPLAKEFVPRNGTQTDNPYWIEYVPMPINYPVIHCTVESGGLL